MYKKTIILLLLFLFCLIYCNEDKPKDQEKTNENPTQNYTYTLEELKKFSHDELRKMLEERVVECAACVGVNDPVEKQHLVNRVFETQHLPIVPEKDRPKKEPEKKPRRPRGPRQKSFKMEPGSPDYESMMNYMREEQARKKAQKEEAIRQMRKLGLDTAPLENQPDEYERFFEKQEEIRKKHEEEKRKKREERRKKREQRRLERLKKKQEKEKVKDQENLKKDDKKVEDKKQSIKDEL